MGRQRKPGAQSSRAAALADRLRQAEETLRAIAQGEVDAIVVSGGRGPRVVGLEGVNAFRPAGSGTAAGSAPLSRRECQVLALLAQGHTYREVADRLELSVKTVETYRTRLGQKLGLRTRADLFRYAVDTGILEPRVSVPPSRKR